MRSPVRQPSGVGAQDYTNSTGPGSYALIGAVSPESCPLPTPSQGLQGDGGDGSSQLASSFHFPECWENGQAKPKGS